MESATSWFRLESLEKAATYTSLQDEGLNWNWKGVYKNAQNKMRVVYAYGNLDHHKWENFLTLPKPEHGGGFVSYQELDMEPITIVPKILKSLQLDKEDSGSCFYIGPGWFLEIYVEKAKGEFEGLKTAFIHDGLSTKAQKAVTMVVDKLRVIHKSNDFNANRHEFPIFEDLERIYYNGRGSPENPPSIFFLLAFPTIVGSVLLGSLEMLDWNQIYTAGTIGFTILVYEGLNMSSIKGVTLLAFANVLPSIIEPYFDKREAQKYLVIFAASAAMLLLIVLIIRDEVQSRAMFRLVEGKRKSVDKDQDQDKDQSTFDWDDPMINDNEEGDSINTGTLGHSEEIRAVDMDFVFGFNLMLLNNKMLSRLSAGPINPYEYLPELLRAHINNLLSTMDMVGIDGSRIKVFTALSDIPVCDDETKSTTKWYDAEVIWPFGFVFEFFWTLFTIFIVICRFVVAVFSFFCIILALLHKFMLLVTAEIPFLVLISFIIMSFQIHRCCHAVFSSRSEFCTCKPKVLSEEFSTKRWNFVETICLFVGAVYVFAMSLFLYFPVYGVIAFVVLIGNFISALLFLLRYYTLKMLASCAGMEICL